MAKKAYNKELEDLLQEVYLNMKYNPDHWSTLTNDNGYYSIGKIIQSKDRKFSIFYKGSMFDPYSYDSYDEKLVRNFVLMYEKFKKRDEKLISNLNKPFLTKVHSYKDILEETLTEEQKKQILKEERGNKFLRILRRKNNE